MYIHFEDEFQKSSELKVATAEQSLLEEDLI